MREGDSIGPKTSGCLEFAVAVFPFRGDDGGEKAFANARDTDRYGALCRVKKKISDANRACVPSKVAFAGPVAGDCLRECNCGRWDTSGG